MVRNDTFAVPESWKSFNIRDFVKDFWWGLLVGTFFEFSGHVRENQKQQDKIQSYTQFYRDGEM